jgi:hypothetical protein
MSLRETPRRSRRDKWPLEFDLTGVPRERAERERMLAELQAPPLSEVEGETTMVQNNFGDNKVIDLSDVNAMRRTDYKHEEFPKLLYKYDSKPKSVNSKEEEEAALADGWLADSHAAKEPPTPTVAVESSSDEAEEADESETHGKKFREISRKKRA